jgi:hypothetical protein
MKRNTKLKGPHQPKSNFCSYCGRFRPLTRDHFFPRSYLTYLAEHDPDFRQAILQHNIVMACFPCQKIKGDMHPQRWLEAMPRGWIQGKQFVKGKLRELNNLPLERLITQKKRPTPKGTRMANYKTGPTRDWAPLMNIMVEELVKASYPDSDLEEPFTHVYKGSIREGMREVRHLGASPDAIARRLTTIGWLKNGGKVAEYQGTTKWLVRNELVSAEDASRADTLYRRQRTSEKRKPKLPYAGIVDDPAMPQGNNLPKPRYDVGEDQLHPGKHVTKATNGPGEYERMNREILDLESQLTKAKAQRDDWRDEAEKLQQKLDATNADELNEVVARYQKMVSQLLEGGEAAKMLHEAAQIGARAS